MPQMPALHHSPRWVVATNTFWQIVGRAVGAVGTFAITVLLARQFGAAGYGDFVKITTFVAFFYLVADFGINAVYLQRNEQWNTLAGLRLILSIVCVLGLVLIVILLPFIAPAGYTPMVRLGILIFAPSILFQALITSTNGVFQKHLRYRQATIALAAGAVVSLLLTWFVVRGSTADNGIVYAVIAQLVGIAVTALTALSFVKKTEDAGRAQLSPPRLRSLFMASIPLGMTLLFNLIYFRVDSIILTITRSSSEVGIYGLAYKVFEVVLVFPTFFMNAVYPLMLNAIRNTGQATRNKEFEDITKKSFIVLLLVSCLLSLFFWVSAPLLSLIKPEFILSTGALRILVSGLPFFFLSSLTMWVLIAYGYERALAWVYAAGMVVNIAANAWFVPRFGYVAAAWVTVASEGVVLLVSSLVLVHAYKRKNSV